MKWLILTLMVALVVCIGCEREETVKQYGPDQTETVKVVCLVYTPSNHGSGIGIGINSKGGISPTIVSVDIPEKYAVVFECQHGKFILGEHNQARAKELFHRLKLNQEYTCTYRELFKVKYHVVDGQRVKELERHLIKYEFVDVR